VVNTPASYLRGYGYKSRPGDQLFWQIFMVFLSVFRRMPGWYLTLVHNRFISISLFTYPFVRRCIAWVAGKASINKLQTTNNIKFMKSVLKIGSYRYAVPCCALLTLEVVKQVFFALCTTVSNVSKTVKMKFIGERRYSPLAIRDDQLLLSHTCTRQLLES
jgi:hypothetical protein